MNGRRRLFVYGATPEEWERRFGVLAYNHPCSACGRMCRTTLPFAQGTLRGLASPPCECGNARTPFVVVRDSRYGDLFTGAEAHAPRRSRARGKRARATIVSLEEFRARRSRI